MTTVKYTFSRTPRRNGRRDPGDLRAGVDLAGLLGRLHEHAMGRRPLKPTQQRAAAIVLDKVLPDLAPSKADAPGQDEERMRRYAAHKERSAWHAAHRAKRERAAESEVNVVSTAGGDEDAVGVVRRH